MTADGKCYPPLGQCMYCGSTVGLTDEHIIPFGLWGNVVLPASSCKTCAGITSGIERKVLRGFMYEARVVADSPSRRKRRRPSHIKKTFIRSTDSGAQEVTENLPVQDGFSLITLPLFERAGILAGRAPSWGLLVRGHEQVRFGKDPLQSVLSSGATGFKGKDEIDVNAFSRMLAKIAYGITVAEHGVFPRSDSPLPAMILSGSESGSNWVGSSQFTLNVEREKPMHALATCEVHNQQGAVGIVAKIKFFSGSGCTGYEVAVRVPGWQKYAAQQVAAVDPHSATLHARN